LAVYIIVSVTHGHTNIKLKCVFKTNITKTRSETYGCNSCRFSAVVLLGVWLLLQDAVC